MPDCSKDAPLSQQLFSIIPLLRNNLMKPCEAIMRSHFTPLQFYVLSTLLSEGSLPLSTLIHRLGMSKQQSTQLLRQLEESGFIRREEEQADRRRVRIYLEAPARQALSICHAQICQTIQTGVRALDPADAQELSRALASLQKILPQMEIQNPLPLKPDTER